MIANIFIIGEIFNLLERVEMMDNFPMSSLDPGNTEDVKLIYEKYIKSFLNSVDSNHLECVRATLFFYSMKQSDKIQKVKDSAQELSLSDLQCWSSFVRLLGEFFFGNSFENDLVLEDIEERPDYKQAQILFFGNVI